MTKKKNQPDANQVAARVVGESIVHHSDPLPSDLEAAWQAWSAGVGNVGGRTMLLLKAAFEAGADAAKKPESQKFGRMGGLVGGKIRAANLTPERRKEIAKQAANKRWKNSNERAAEI